MIRRQVDLVNYLFICLSLSYRSISGPNDWNPNNVWLDTDGRLHLKLRYSPETNQWTCAELYTKEKFTFGKYRWFIEGQIDKFDPNVVLGLFTYGGLDGTNEIDIEIARWGSTDKEAKNLFYTTYPNRLDRGGPVSTGKLMSLQGTYTTHEFVWTPKSIRFQSRHGFTDVYNFNVISTYQTASTFRSSMPTDPAPLHMNLWAFKGRAPLNGEEVEIILHDFRYIKA